MGIQAVLDNLDAIEGEAKSFYKEQDGKFVLDVDGLDDHPTVRGVITANKANKEKRDAHKTELEAIQARLAKIPEDFDPDAYAEMKEQIEKNTGPDVEEKMSKMRAKLEESHGAQLKTKDELLSVKDKAINKMVVDEGLLRAMSAADIEPAHQAKLVPYLKSLGKIAVEQDGETFKASVDTDLGPVSLKNFVAEWAATDDGKIYVAKSTGPKPRDGNGKGGSATVTRSQFNAMSHADRAKIATGGIKVVDD